MNLTHKTLLGIGLAAISFAAFTPAAQARAVGGFGGHANNPAQTSCFSENWNGVINTCTTAYRWDTPLVVDPAGNYTPSISVYVSGVSSNVSCTVQAVSSTGTVFSSTPWVSPGVGNANVSISPGTVTVPAGGTLEAPCFLSQNSQIHAIAW